MTQAIDLQSQHPAPPSALFAESDWPRLCDALIAHVNAKRAA